MLKFMKKMLCPYCDHEIMGKGRCSFCGSKVKKPVYAETSDDFNTSFSTENEDKSYKLEQPQQNSIDADLLQSENEFTTTDQKEQARPFHQINKEVPNAAPPAQPRAKAMLASEAVAESVKKGTNVTKGSSTVSKIVTVLVIVWIVFTALSIITNLLIL